MSKFVTLEEAMSKIKDGAAIINGGFGSLGSPEELYSGVADYYAKTGHPKNITLVCGITPGDKTESTEPYKGYNIGPNKMAAEGLLGRIWCGNLTDARAIAYQVADNKYPAYLPPMGVMCNLFRCAAGGRPGLITKVGLGTFADPRIDGCAVNQKAREAGSVVELMEINGEEYLFYRTPPADVAFIRATYADEDGNLTMCNEAIHGTELEVAVAAHNNGGIVIAQVEGVVKRNTLSAKDVRIHHKLVDYVVVAQDPMNNRQCYATTKVRPELSGDIKLAGNATKQLPLNDRKVIARRAAMELRPNIIINLGSGIPSGIGSVAAEEGIEGLTTSVESGPMGGQVQEGLSFPSVANAECMFPQTDTIDMYDGGMLDMAFLGGAEIDQKGNVNVSKFAGRCIGAGGYINISQNAKTVFFLGRFTAGKCELEIKDGKLNILKDGAVKFVNEVQQITFSGDFALKHNQKIMYITERAVFKLAPEGGLELVEIAPGVDLEKDILAKMEFAPKVSPDLKLMDERIFRDAVMGIIND